ncbi:MAG TPA: RodZ domain-containing protein [Steroidobacteraceae bacterium]|jgi:cytoskeleton protein RodZ|nr:RodZ domain-containing protein [Steroidobacteraceae bacterium]
MSAALEVGPRLKAERIAKGLSVARAADAMHLDAWVVDALEADDHGRIGPEVFVRGHLRRYAGLLGLPVADVIGAYEAHRPARKAAAEPTPPATQAHELKAAVSLAWPSVGALAALIVIGIGTYWVKPWRTPGSDAPHAVNRTEASSGGALVSPPALMAAAEPRPPAPAAAAASALHPQAARSGVLMPAAAPAAAALAPAGDSLDAVQGTGHARLRLSFSADSWVDVHDAAGRRVFAGNGRANSVKTLSGAAPMHVYLRYASGVQLEINDRAVAIGRQFMAGDVARFEAGADGVLRRELRAADAPPVAQTRDERPSG